MKVPADSVYRDSAFWCTEDTSSPVCSHSREGVREISGLFEKGTDPVHEGCTLSHLPEAPPPNTITSATLFECEC